MMHRTIKRRRQRRRTAFSNLQRARRRRRQELQQAMFLGFIMFLAVLLERPERIGRRIWAKPRLRVYWQSILDGWLWEDVDWQENLRMSRETFFHLVEKLRPRLQRQNTSMRRAITVDERLAICLWKLATNIEYRTLGQHFGVGRSTICVILHETCDAVCELLKDSYMKFPTGNRMITTIEGYEGTWGFPNCAGAIDGMHVPIKAPIEHAADYFNRNKYHSIVMQGVCDSQYRFTDIFFGFAGRAHDARVLANSSLFRLAEQGILLPQRPRRIGGNDINPVIIGDPAYPLLPWLMKPFAHRGQLNAQQRRYNYRLSRARMTIEDSFGRLKGRWRCLLKKNDFKLENIHNVVLAACILHNVCEMHNEVYYDRWDEEVRAIEGQQPLRVGAQNVNVPVAVERDAHGIRESFVRHFSH